MDDPLVKIIEKQRRRWGNQYGDTHRGYRILLFGVPIWQVRRPLQAPPPRKEESFDDWSARQW